MAATKTKTSEVAAAAGMSPSPARVASATPVLCSCWLRRHKKGSQH